MDELLMSLRVRFQTDDVLAGIVQAAGGVAGAAFAIAPHQRQAAGYPRIILDGDEGEEDPFSEDEPPVLLDGRVRIEIVTRQSDACPKPLGAFRLIQRRVMTLILGDSTQGITPIKGSLVSDPGAEPGDPDVWNVTAFRQVKPTGMLPVTDPSFVRHITTFQAGLYRIDD